MQGGGVAFRLEGPYLWTAIQSSLGNWQLATSLRLAQCYMTSCFRV